MKKSPLITGLIKINSKEQYAKEQKELLAKGYKWIDGDDKYYDLYEDPDEPEPDPDYFFEIVFIVHHESKTFEWAFPSEEGK